MARQRDYKAEYQRRMASAAARGLSKSQARGHARAGETSLKAKPEKKDPALEVGLKSLHKQGSLTRAAKEARVSPERLSRFIHVNALAERHGRTWKITDSRHRHMQVISNGEIRRRVLAGFDQASLNGTYLNAVKQFIRTNDRDLLAPFIGCSVVDASGKSHLLETDPNLLYRLAHSGNEVFEDVYRLT